MDKKEAYLGQIKLAKDILLGFMSSSALLLTLVLAFISPTVPRVQYLNNILALATFGLFFTVAWDGTMLGFLFLQFSLATPSTRRLWLLKVVLGPQAISFVFGVACIASSILVSINHSF